MSLSLGVFLCISYTLLTLSLILTHYETQRSCNVSLPHRLILKSSPLTSQFINESIPKSISFLSVKKWRRVWPAGCAVSPTRETAKSSIIPIVACSTVECQPEKWMRIERCHILSTPESVRQCSDFHFPAFNTQHDGVITKRDFVAYLWFLTLFHYKLNENMIL
jgi:hypothetical protein